MFWPPPVVMLITASQPALIRGRNALNRSGDGDGRPSIGIARVQVDDRGAGLGRADRLLRRSAPA